MDSKSQTPKVMKARRYHIPEIVRLWQEFMRYHIDMVPDFTISKNAPREFGRYLEEILGSRKHRLLVAVIDDALIGYALLSINKRPPIFRKPRYGMISDAYVSEKYRNRGTGTLLMHEALIWFKKKGVTRIELIVASENDIGCAFWKREGFIEHSKKMYRYL
jgi:ribosomal protein S18 acetylase RimI-like enzyme